jgi:hypothetical protein
MYTDSDAQAVKLPLYMSTQSDLNRTSKRIRSASCKWTAAPESLAPPDVTVGFLSIPMSFIFPVIGLRYYVWLELGSGAGFSSGVRGVYLTITCQFQYSLQNVATRYHDVDTQTTVTV